MLSPVKTLSLGSLLLVILAGCSPEHYPQTTLLPLSDFARIGDAVQDQTFYWALGVFILVEGAFLYAIFRFRGRPNDPEPRQVHGNTVVEIIWTLIPALILASIAVPTVKGIFRTNQVPGENALKVQVIGHQWWWEFRYPDYEITTANELYIPVGRTVEFYQISGDVIHSFWPPRFAGKRDVFPNRETRLWFTADSAGEFPGQCAEFCGIQHARMSFRIRAQPAEEFDAWVARMRTLGPAPAARVPAAPQAAAAPSDSLRTASAGASAGVRPAGSGASAKPGATTAAAQGSPAQAAPAPADTAAKSPLYAQGEKLFITKGCAGCHSLQAYKAPPLVGPNLANVGARSMIAAGTLTNTDENLARWIREPQTIKEGVLMPNLGVTEQEAQALVAFLRAHQ